MCKNCGHVNPIIDGHVITTNNYINERNWESANNSFEPLPGGKMAYSKLGGPRIGELISKFNIDGLAINLGSGQDNYPGYINVDLGIYKPVHIVAELQNLPFKSASINLIASNVLKDKFEIVDQGACRGVAYVLIPYVNYLLAYKIKNKLMLGFFKGLWQIVSRPLFSINDDSNEQYQSLSQTIYILVRKK